MIWVIVYLVAIVAANFSIATFGPVSMPINAFLLIALDLVARDRLHDVWSHRGLIAKMGALIVAGGIVSYAVNPAAGRIAVASSASFVLAAIADTAIYHLRRHDAWMVRSNKSNIVSAAVDSIAFPAIAFGALLPWVVLAQFAAKTLGGVFWSYVIDINQLRGNLEQTPKH